MKKADNFDSSKWLVENKITTQSKLNKDENIEIIDSNNILLTSSGTISNGRINIMK